MRRNKREEHFERVRQYKKDLARWPSALLRERLALPGTIREAAIAMRPILEERGDLYPNSN